MMWSVPASSDVLVLAFTLYALTNFIVIAKHSFRIPSAATDNRESTLDLQKQEPWSPFCGRFEERREGDFLTIAQSD